MCSVDKFDFEKKFKVLKIYICVTCTKGGWVIYIGIFIFSYIYIYIYICNHICIHICIYILIYICILIYIYICIMYQGNSGWVIYGVEGALSVGS